MNRFYVYVAFHPLSGEPRYVGKGCGNRWQTHNVGRSHNPHLAAIIKKHGPVPTVRVRTGMTEADAFAIEAAFIAAIGRGKNGPLVNLTDGGEGTSGAVHSAASREKISAAAKNISNETRERMRKPRSSEARANMRKPKSAEHRAKISAALSNPSAEMRARLSAAASNPSAGARANMRAAQIGKPKAAEHTAKAVASRARNRAMKAAQLALPLAA